MASAAPLEAADARKISSVICGTTAAEPRPDRGAGPV